MESLRDEPDHTAFNKFKAAVRNNFYTLVCIDAKTGSQDCQQSLDLFFAYFNDPDFLYRLVITEMVVDPQIQFTFLKSYVVQMQKQIQDTVRDFIFQPEKQRDANLYKTLLIVFTKRLCEYEPSQVDAWVCKDYFPTEDCITVCREMKNSLAEARLVEKLGDGRRAVSIYLEYVAKIDMKRITDQLLMISVSEHPQCGTLDGFEYLSKFDSTLVKACEIAERKNDTDGAYKYTEEAYYLILEFLQDYLINCGVKLTPQVQERERRVQRLKQFVLSRIKCILEREQCDLNLRQVHQRLGLELE